MISIKLTVNGEEVAAQVEPRTHLADFLREQRRLTGTHLGCEHGVCGACTVLIDGAPARSCITYAAACDGRDVRTIEGFDDDAVMGELREAFSREHGLQCGFCTPGMLITARDIVQRLPGADERRIRIELAGNLCRCTGFVGIVNAVKRVAAQSRGAAPAPRPVVAAAPFAPFVPVAVCDAPPEEASVMAVSSPAATRLEESFFVDHAPERVWQAFGDMPAVAACLPGAEVTDHDPQSVKGRIKVKFGPMRFAFNGAASLQRDDAAMCGTIRGAGSDGASGSKAKGEISYRLLREPGRAGTRVAITLDYSLQGPLAQFSRSGLVKDFAKRLVVDFGRNLDAHLAGSMPPQSPGEPAQLDAFALVWKWLWGRIRRAFAG